MSLGIVGYASLDYSTVTASFRGVDSTSILERAIVTDTPGVGGIAHIAAAAATAGAETEAISWVGPDAGGRRWSDGLRSSGCGTNGVVAAGTRSPSATLIEIGTGGTICLFDPGDCHPPRLGPAQRAVLERCTAVVLTAAPRALTTEVLETLPQRATLVWAVKHDDDAYDEALVRRLTTRSDIVSFSSGERGWLSDGVGPPETTARAGTLVIETRGAAGVAWALNGFDGLVRRNEVRVEPVEADDTTGAGDTFIGTLAASSMQDPRPLSERADHEIDALIASASRAAGDLLRRRSTAARAGAPSKGTHP